VSKPTVHEVSVQPLRVTLMKNGRPVGEASALAALRKCYPAVSEWDLRHGRDRTIAMPKDRS